MVSGVEFLRRGGGSFLWFFPGMFLFYFMTPLWLRVKEAFSKSGLLVMLMGWLLLAVFVQFVLKQNQLLLLIHRMPIFFLGLYYEEGKALIPVKWRIPVLIGLLVVGSFLIYRYGAIVKVNNAATMVEGTMADVPIRSDCEAQQTASGFLLYRGNSV